MPAQRLFVVCAVDADEVGQIRGGRPRWNRARWDASVYHSLERLYSRVELLGVDGSGLGVADLFALKRDGATVVFNLALSATPWEAAFVACAEFAGLRTTGSGALAVALANDKIRSRTLLAAAGIRVPRFIVLRQGERPGPIDLTPPVIVKPAYQSSSSGIARDSVVTTERDAIARARRIWKRFDEPAICDEFVQGRELRVGLIEDHDGTWTIAGIGDWSFPGADRGFRTERARKGQRMRALRASQLPSTVRTDITGIAQKACGVIGLRGYASMDVRVDTFGRVTVLEVNSNPGLSADSPVWGARGFDRTLRQIVNAALRQIRNS
jgi:D-alanine-D-alanine ligase